MNARSVPILLTGFGPFPGVPVNESTRLVISLTKAAQQTFTSHHFVSEILRTEWSEAPGRTAELLREHRPALALHFGVARGCGGFRIETKGVNACNATADAASNFAHSVYVVNEGPAAIPVTVNATAIAAHLAARGFNSAVSDDAGDYLCNAVLYQSLAAAALMKPRPRVGFIHIPVDLTAPPLTFDVALAGALEILAFCLK